MGQEDIPGPDVDLGLKDAANGSSKKSALASQAAHHPSGKAGHGPIVKFLRGFVFAVYFWSCCLVIGVTQLIGAPLYFVNKDMYYAYMAMTKRSFALVITVMTRIWGRTMIRVSGDESVAGQIKKMPDGTVQFDFPERLIYTDWLYLWWVGYANRIGMHGHIYIILKDSLRWIPIMGTGMMFFGFIFMSRKMATDRPRLAHRLQKLRQLKSDPNGNKYYDPMWLLLFPEGTNLSANGRRKSSTWAAKNDLQDPEHVMLPRSTGTFFCLNELKGSVEYVYDCTVAYEGIKRGEYGEELFTLSGTYFAGRPPKSVNFHWRRFRLADIPLDDPKEFEEWLRNEWYKKDELMEIFMKKGRFPPMTGSATPYVETEVRTRSPFEILQIFAVVGIAALMWNNVQKLYTAVNKMSS
ncbi:Phospholipid/glycerol acyltransferase [Akanthomyces lecanii RCEF 1005]|uniref:Phospholipid/glycerol acyltransferase n=1 Tax=Akanthomyces lecanii RCEF 1005 TaxID=1081108 RepID=A0A168HZX3_CORDF|nr:Phospholipid/glycerol acyltransferase [Akanthomyces lecanii RCEF 1005]